MNKCKIVHLKNMCQQNYYKVQNIKIISLCDVDSQCM